ncbi:adenylate kinase [Massilicoli timonensis]|uniref:Adenylate kinase n=1 Tax=Massilicoli timonensis TaxID=2015901 RepID=A0ABT1SMV1_9FIRM|nr:adenylate kinase [Massilicoli timonensis]MCQ5122035.1 adenylate kinase [Massilicoli timonensis]
MNILIMGGPGAGKGTMSAKIVEKYQVNHISTGNIFRSEIKNETELGLQAKSYTEKGLLVPDEVTNPMVKSFLEKLDNKNGYLLDGYPRTLDQAKAFDELTVGSDLAVEKVIALELDFEVLKDRITGRRICKNCEEIYHIKNHPSKVEGVCDKCGGELYQRKDDTVESLQVRLGEYSKSTEPVLAYYEEKGLLTRINADQPIEAVWQDVMNALEK